MDRIATVFVCILAVSLYENLALLLKITNIDCRSFNESWVTIDHCRLRAIHRDKTVVNINATLHHAANDINLRMQVLKKGYTNVYRPWLIDITFDACAFMRKANNPMAKLGHNWIKNFSTVNHTCPYVGLQQVKDFYVKAYQMPPGWPTGDFAFLMTWILSGRPQYVTNFYFRFEEDLINQ